MFSIVKLNSCSSSSESPDLRRYEREATNDRALRQEALTYEHLRLGGRLAGGIEWDLDGYG